MLITTGQFLIQMVECSIKLEKFNNINVINNLEVCYSTGIPVVKNLLKALQIIPYCLFLIHWNIMLREIFLNKINFSDSQENWKI
jgi:hypothetical protein